MKKRGKIIAAAGLCLFLGACAKEPDDSIPVNEILSEQPYVEAVLGGGYHQERVTFDQENDRAVIAKDAEWGRPGFRDGTECGTYYGEEEGGEIYDTDRESSPELYLDSYFDSIRNLNLTAKDVKKENYVIQVVASDELELFGNELAALTSVIMKDSYELTGVEIEFDRQCRPVRKSFQLRDIREDELKKKNLDSESCIQEFSYKTGESKFERTYEKVKAEIERE